MRFDLRCFYTQYLILLFLIYIAILLALPKKILAVYVWDAGTGAGYETEVIPPPPENAVYALSRFSLERYCVGSFSRTYSDLQLCAHIGSYSILVALLLLVVLPLTGVISTFGIIIMRLVVK